MRAQLLTTGPIRPLAARPIGQWVVGQCHSCGDPLGPADRYRCDFCVRAAWRALREARRGAWHMGGCR
jgi:hypothetical protein